MHCFRKSIHKGISDFIHFNLTLALLIGSIVFVSSIETAKDDEVITIAAHYLDDIFVHLLLSRLAAQ